MSIESNLKAAEVETQKWRSRIDQIDGKIREAQAVLDKSENRRAEHALAAVTGNATATAAMTKIRRENENAEKDIADLRLALPEAQRRLAEAERAEKAARLAINQAVANVLRRKRIECGKRLDAASNEFDAAYREFTELGEQLHAHHLEMLAARGYSHETAVAAMENLAGIQRLTAALPPMFRRLFPTAIFPPRQTPLAKSEAEFWGLSVEENTNSAAA